MILLAALTNNNILQLNIYLASITSPARSIPLVQQVLPFKLVQKTCTKADIFDYSTGVEGVDMVSPTGVL